MSKTTKIEKLINLLAANSDQDHINYLEISIYPDYDPDNRIWISVGALQKYGEYFDCHSAYAAPIDFDSNISEILKTNNSAIENRLNHYCGISLSNLAGLTVKDLVDYYENHGGSNYFTKSETVDYGDRHIVYTIETK